MQRPLTCLRGRKGNCGWGLASEAMAGETKAEATAAVDFTVIMMAACAYVSCLVQRLSNKHVSAPDSLLVQSAALQEG